MIKFMVPVVRDMIAEQDGIETMVGEQVEVIKKIRKNGRILVSTPGHRPRIFPVNKDVYLVKAKISRFMSHTGRCTQVMVLHNGYEGNDIYSAEELGVNP